MNPDVPINSNVQANQNTLPALVDNVTSQFIVTPASPTTIGVSGFIFNIIGDEEISLDSEITDSFVENNSAIQDQIAIRPEQFTLSGYVGEIVNDINNVFTRVLTSLLEFGNPPGMGVTLNIQDQQFYDLMAEIAASEVSIINTAENIYSLFSNFSTTASMQQNGFQYFYNLWLSRTLCEVQTPWGTLQNMAILNVRARQDETTRLFTSFSVTFKAIRFASTSTLPSTSTSGTSTTSSSSVVPTTASTPQATQATQTTPTPPVPSTATSPQATATLQSVTDNCSETGLPSSNTLLSNTVSTIMPFNLNSNPLMPGNS